MLAGDFWLSGGRELLWREGIFPPLLGLFVK
jgi:hypothetical protein